MRSKKGIKGTDEALMERRRVSSESGATRATCTEASAANLPFGARRCVNFNNLPSGSSHSIGFCYTAAYWQRRCSRSLAEMEVMRIRMGQLTSLVEQLQIQLHALQSHHEEVQKTCGTTSRMIQLREDIRAHLVLMESIRTTSS